MLILCMPMCLLVNHLEIPDSCKYISHVVDCYSILTIDSFTSQNLLLPFLSGGEERGSVQLTQVICDDHS